MMEEEEFVECCVDAIVNGMKFREAHAEGGLRSRKSLRKKPSLKTTGDPRADAKACFLQFDIDESGELDIYEFMSAMKELGLGFTYKDAKTLFSKIDTDGSGTMDLDEFTAHYLEFCTS